MTKKKSALEKSFPKPPSTPKLSRQTLFAQDLIEKINLLSWPEYDQNATIEDIKSMLSQKNVEVNGEIINVHYVRWTPLKHAIWCGHPEIVKLLIRAGADVNKQGLRKEAPLMTALQAMEVFPDNKHTYMDIIKILIDSGADTRKCKKFLPPQP